MDESNAPMLPSSLAADLSTDETTGVVCKKCGQKKPVGKTKGWCRDCEKAYVNRYSYIRRTNANWMDIAKENGLNLWDRQPGETQLEWTIWVAYRDSYPGKKPSYKDVTQIVDTTYDFVVKTASRWDFAARLQAWIAECDRITLDQRRTEILDMNAQHIRMAKKLRDKLDVAIDHLEPELMKPSDLNSLLKTMATMEKAARLDIIETDGQRREAIVGVENPNLKKNPTKQNDLNEVLGILLKAGALGDVSSVGVRKTETTEVVVKDADGNMSGVTLKE